MRTSSLVLVAFLACSRAGSAETGGDLAAMEKDVLGKLQAARAEAGLPALVLDPVLDRVAAARARAVAVLPFDERMSPTGTIQRLVEGAGIRRYRTVSEHVEVQGGYPDPAQATMDRWKKYDEDWSRVMQPEALRVGLGVARSDDGLLAFVAVLLAEAPAPPDLRALEEETEDAINRARVEHGLAKLLHSPALAEVARGHSEDMAKRRYFDHRTPDGLGPSDRVKAEGMRYERMAENIAVNAGMDSPVDVAVQGWLESQHHRENLLGPFVLTAVGIAETDEGEIYFTQLFLTPPPDRSPR
jgi:uncharacterized protein YkwD